MGIVRRQPSPSKPPDAIDTVPDPDIIAQRLAWTVLTRRISWLRAYRTDGDLCRPPETDDPRVLMVWHLCDPAYADVVKVILSGELAEIVEVV